jgi:hypothetical protein
MLLQKQIVGGVGVEKLDCNELDVPDIVLIIGEGSHIFY